MEHCRIHGEGRCPYPDTVRADAPCDAFGPVCFQIAMECPCHVCSERDH